MYWGEVHIMVHSHLILQMPHLQITSYEHAHRLVNLILKLVNQKRQALNRSPGIRLFKKYDNTRIAL